MVESVVFISHIGNLDFEENWSNIDEDTCFKNYYAQQIITNNILLCDLCMEFSAIKMTSNTKYV